MATLRTKKNPKKILSPLSESDISHKEGSHTWLPKTKNLILQHGNNQRNKFT